MRWQRLGLAAVIVVVSVASPLWSQQAERLPPSPLTQDNVLEYQTQEQQHVIPSPEIPTPAPPPPREPPQPAQTGAIASEPLLWKLLQQQQYTKLRQEIRRLTQKDPHWRPPQRLVALLAAGEARQAIQLAIQKQQWQRLIALSQQYPQQFTCHHIDHLWALAEAYHAQAQTGQVLAVYERIIPACKKDADRLATLHKATQLLPPDATASLLSREAPVAKSPAAHRQFAEIRYQFYVNQLVAVTQSDTPEQSPRLEGIIRDEIIDRRDVNMAMLLGWDHFRVHRFAQAGEWFAHALAWDHTREEAAYGLALASMQQGDSSRAEAIARQWQQHSPRLRNLLGELLFARAILSYRNKHYADSLSLLHESERYRGEQRESRLLTAWTFYELGDTAQAAQEFAALYHAQPDEESAQGAFYSYARQKDWQSIEALAESVSGPLTSLWSTHLGQRYYDHQLFVLAEHTAPDRFPQLRHVTSPSVASGVAFRHKSGTRGLSRFNIEQLPLATGSVYSGMHRLSLRLTRISLDSGRLTQHALVGTVPVTPTAYSTNPTTRLDGGLESSLLWSHEGWMTPYAELGVSLTHGKASSLPIWRLGLTTQAEHGHWNGELFSQPVRESLLSYTGMTDPYSGQKWGRVLQTGGRLFWYRGLGEQWGVSSHAGAAWLGGKKVEDNYHVTVGANLVRTVKPAGFEYVSVGPRVAFDHYGKNLSQFTLGHGGYFSPDSLVQIVAAATFLSTEGKRFLLKGDTSVGFQTHHESSSPFFPRHPDGRRYAATNDSGVVFSTELIGLLRLGAHWQVGGGFIARKTATYDDFMGMVFVNFFFASRNAVVTTDIPPFLLQTLY